MAEPLKKPVFWANLLLLAMLALLVYGSWWIDAGLKDLAIYSGWTLAALSLFLAIYNLRKKIASLPIGRAWYWRRLHSFAGWLTVAVFLIHAGPTPPVGTLHLLMWCLYVVILLSGIAGLWFSLVLPPRIAKGAERLQFERIPNLREAQYARAERVIFEASRDGIGEPLQVFHELHLRDYLGRSREQLRHCFNSAGTAEKVLRELKNIGRYVHDSSRPYVTELEDIIYTKNELDRQFALQNLLRKWTWLHVASNYLSWILIAVHVLLIYTFRGEYGL